MDDIAKKKAATAAYLVQKFGSIRKAAKETDIPRSTLQGQYKLSKMLSKAELDNYDPIPVADGFKLKGTSTLVDKDGNKKLQWIKTTADLERQKAMFREMLLALAEDIPREKPVKLKPEVDDSLLSQYVITDYHIGQLSDERETGEAWNAQIAEDLLVKWFASAIAAAPASHTGVFCQLGDFLHFDSLLPVTPSSKHILDADSKYPKIVRIAMRAVRRIVRMMLAKHKHVHIIMAEGNHDTASSVNLREAFAMFFEDEPRVTVETSDSPYYVYKWGKTALYYHHGHKQNITNVSKVFASVFKQIYGAADYNYGHMGHLHHIDCKEDALMIIRQHPTLAAKDSYSTRGGYLSQRSASVLTYSKNYGYVSEVNITPEMLKSR